MPKLKVSTTTAPGTWLATCGTTEVAVRKRKVTVGASTPTGRGRVKPFAERIAEVLRGRRFNVKVDRGASDFGVTMRVSPGLKLEDARAIGDALLRICGA